jgi:choline dehydrogenase-like flavoprotein
MTLVVVGSGASACHFALTALERGAAVTMLDVGLRGAPPVRPEDSFERLKETLPDPTTYFLGEHFEAVSLPGDEKEYYGFPPNKNYVFTGVDSFRHRSLGFAPLVSFAQGGLAETWTAGAFPFNDGELADFPFRYEELAPYYDLVAERIGITGTNDDLARHHPVHRHLLEPLKLDEHSRTLLDRARAKASELEQKSGCVIGRSRVATLPHPMHDRPACSYLGRCLSGCPTGALYTPSMTLDRCRTFPSFTYLNGRLVRHFRFDANRRITAVVAENLETRTLEEISASALVLAAGTLGTSKIVLDSWFLATGERVVLRGLMDNRQILMPFLTPAMIRRPHNPNTYQYHQIALGLVGREPRDYIHGLVTTLKTAMIHPIVKSLPFDLATSLRLFRNVHAGLGLVNVNFPDHRRGACTLTIESSETVRDLDGCARTLVHVHYESERDEPERLRQAMSRVKRALGILGSYVPPKMSHVRPMGASVHYAGTIPMTREAAPWTTTGEGRSRDFENLWIADGTTFPFLPAKNLTFTLMANASRIAEAMVGKRAA